MSGCRKTRKYCVWPNKGCKFPGCKNPHEANNYCGFHYRRWLNKIPLDAPYYFNIPQCRECAVKGCDEPPRSGGYCSLHYDRWRKGISLDMPKRVKADHGCTFSNCSNSLCCNGLCAFHDQRRRKGIPLDAPYKFRKLKPKTKCKIKGCDNIAGGRKMCNTHNTRWARGDRGARLERPVRKNLVNIAPMGVIMGGRRLPA